MALQQEARTAAASRTAEAEANEIRRVEAEVRAKAVKEEEDAGGIALRAQLHQVEDELASAQALLRQSAAETERLEGALRKVELSGKKQKVELLRRVREAERTAAVVPTITAPSGDDQATGERVLALVAELAAERESTETRSEELAASEERTAVQLAEHTATLARLETESTTRVRSLLEELSALRGGVEVAEGATAAALKALAVKSQEYIELEAKRVEERVAMGLEVDAARQSKAALVATLMRAEETTAQFKQDLGSVREDVKVAFAEAQTASQHATALIVAETLRLASELENVQQKYKSELTERRRYFNLVQELRGNIRVLCRVRHEVSSPGGEHPSGGGHIAYPQAGHITIERPLRAGALDTGSGARSDKAMDFEYDKVFAGGAQTEVFADTKSLITSCMDGYNVCIFAYGQSGAGKTHTMSGPAEDPGVTVRALQELFRVANERAEDYDYRIVVSMLEIYNEEIRDLLDFGNRLAGKKLDVSVLSVVLQL
jgi:kinesin family protein C2/C3